MTVNEGDIIRATAVMRTTDQVTVENVFHTQAVVLTVDTDDAVSDDMAAWLDFAYTEIVSWLPGGLSFIEVQVFNVTQDTPMPVASWPTLTVGGSGGDISPEGVAALIVFRTAVSRVLGRKFIGTLSEAGMTNGLLVASALVDLASFAAALVPVFSVGPGSNQYRMGILGKTGVLHAITEAVIRDLPAYQRRRRRGRGI